MRTTRRAGVPALVLLGLLSPSCQLQGGGDRWGGTPGRPGGGVGPGSDAKAAVPVEVAAVTRGSIARSLDATTRLAAEAEVSVVARVPARLLRLSADVGDLAREGAEIARLDDTEVRHALEEAEAEAANREREHERAVRAFEQGVMSREVFEAARTAAETARARAQGERLRLSWTVVRAPIDGVVVERTAEVGQVVAAGAQLARIADVDPLRAEVDLPERDLASVRPGLPVELRVDAFPGEIFHGRVERVAPFVSPLSGTFSVRVEVTPDPVGRLRPGLFSRVRILVDRHDDVLLAPRRALLVDRDGDAAFVARDGVAQLAPLRLGHADGDLVEVVEGLDEGSLVVVLGQDSLSPGTPLRVLGAGAGDAGGRAATGASESSPGAGGAAGGERDAAQVAAQLERFQRMPGFKERWDEAVAKDPELATDPKKQAEYLSTMRERFRGGR